MASLSSKYPILIHTESVFIYSLPEDKPDVRHHPLTLENIDTRPRTTQSTQKGPTCFFYAMHPLRLRIGPNPSPEYHEAREVEKRISDHRKNITAWRMDTLPAVIRSFENMTAALEISTGRSDLFRDRAIIEGLLEQMNGPTIMDERRVVAAKAKELFEQFYEQNDCEDLIDFIDAKNKATLIGFSLDFLTKLTKDPKKAYEERLSRDVSETFSMEYGREITPSDPLVTDAVAHGCTSFEEYKERVWDMCELAHLEAAKAFGFEFAPWTPEDSVIDLQHCLKTYGPLIVTGKFGAYNYLVDAEVKETIAGRSIYGWMAKDRIPEPKQPSRLGTSYHAVILIGAKKAGFVYFLDPDYGMEKIHLISYANLTTHALHKGSLTTFAETRSMKKTYPPSYALLHSYLFYHP
ncbi:MAG: hypothetical protein V4492_09805 [Chlamydiota bacterium]